MNHPSPSMNFLRTVLFALTALLLPAPAATVDAVFTSATTIPVTAAGYTATGNDVNLTLGFAPPTGTSLTVVKNTGLAFIDGRFSNLAQGQKVNLLFNATSYPFVVNYYGGTGNDLVLVWAYQSPVAWGSGGLLGNNIWTNSSTPVAVATTDRWGATGALAGKTVFSISAGMSHSLALCSDGTVAAWGGNNFGQLGNGNWGIELTPVLVATTGVLAGKTVVAVAAGGSHNLALCSDGTVAAWGDNTNGQLGNSSTASSTTPVAVTTAGVLAGKTVIAIAAGWDHSLALCADGTVAAWGNNIFGQLGNGSTTQSSLPVAVIATGVLAGKTVVKIAAGSMHCLALCADGTVAAWGANTNGQLGNGTVTNNKVPVAISASGLLAGKAVASIATGWNHSLALCADGSVAAWGYNYSGQLGNGLTSDSLTPEAVVTSGVLAGKPVAAISAGSGHSLALAAIPLSNNANLADLTITSAPLIPVLGPGVRSLTASVSTNISNITVTATAAHPLASLTVNGGAVTSGTASQSIPLAFGVNTITVTVVSESHAASSFYTLSILRPAPVTPTFTATTVPPVSFPAYDATGNTVSFGLGYAPAPGTTLTVIDNTGLGFITGRFSNLAQGQTVNLSYGGVTYPFIANYYGGTGNDLVLEWAQRQPTAWGSNAAGQLGDGGVIDRSVPTAVTTTGALANKSILSLAGGDNHSLALCADGTVAAWGYNLFGQLGNNSTTDSPAPVAVMTNDALAGKTVVAVAAGAIHSLALCSDGTVAAWGANYSGQLGNNRTTSSRIPVTVRLVGALYGKSVVAIAAGDAHSLALCSDGTVVAWGDNYSGQLGTNSTAQSREPVAVSRSGALAERIVVAIAAGATHSLALCSDGTVVGWGYNGYGQLGGPPGEYYGATGYLSPSVMGQTGSDLGKAVVQSVRAATTT